MGGPSALAFSFDDLVRDATDGVYVTDIVGLDSGVNPASGTFSVGAPGRRISGGALSDPLTEFTFDPQSIGAVRAAGRETRWVPFGGSVNAPALLIGEMAIGGSQP